MSKTWFKQIAVVWGAACTPMAEVLESYPGTPDRNVGEQRGEAAERRGGGEQSENAGGEQAAAAGRRKTASAAAR